MFSTAFKGNYGYLSTKIVLSTDVLQALRDNNVFSVTDIQTFTNPERYPADNAKVAQMLQMLEKKGDDKFVPFLSALAVSHSGTRDNEEVVRKLGNQANVPQEILRQLLEDDAASATSTPNAPSAASVAPTVPAPSTSGDAAATGKQDVKETEYPGDNFNVSVDGMKKTSPEFKREHEKQAFPMTSDPRGTALIINIYRTSGESDREGTQVDCKNLVKLFDKLRFRVEVYSDLDDKGELKTTDIPNARNIRIKIRRTLEDMESTAQCFILVTLSHGGINNEGQEVIYGCDGKEVTKNEILDTVDVLSTNGDFSDLKDIPRLVIFQCCRGDKQLTRDCSDARVNTILCHSCTREYVSYKSDKDGTRFVRAFVDTFINHAHDTDIRGLMDKVKKAMKTIDSESKYDQIPEYIVHPVFEKKKLYFFP